MLKEWLWPGNGSELWKQAFSGWSSFAVADPSFPMGMLPTRQGRAGSEPHRGEEAESWMSGRLENACLPTYQYSTAKNDLFPLVESIQGRCDDGS